MKHLVLIILFAAGIPRLLAQVEEEDKKREAELRAKAEKAAAETTIVEGWTHSAVAGLNVGQASYTNWAAGGENSLSYTAHVNGRSMLRGPQFDWMNTYKFMFGQARLSNQGLRKTDDEIYFESLLMYRMSPHFNPYASVTLRSQFAPGYVYPDDVSEVQVSKFFDPAYLTQSVGMAYRPAPEVVTRLGIAAREVITSSFNQYADDGETPEIEKTRILGGLEWVTDVKWGFYDDMEFLSRLEVFSPFESPTIMSVRWDNSITAKVNEYINAMVSMQLIYDEVVTPRTQVKEGVSLGVSYTLL
jgi:hypothetical protein